jgi:group II intron reverse transcriptase/maturase
MGLMFEEEGLRESFTSLDGRKACGVDEVRKEDYGRNLESNLKDLASRIRRLGYRPKPVRRVYIPKSGGGKRPLGIPCTEDKIVQDRMSQILVGIWEPQFCDCSYGYRPGRSAHDALKRLTQVVFKEWTQYVVEADIKGFFSNVSHEHLLRFLKHRIGDPVFLRLVERFLKAGVMEDGAFHGSEAGTPQGGLVSPVLSNIYLHYVLDLWFEKRFAKKCRGKVYLIRYCDDFVGCFEYREDAEMFHHDMQLRLKEFNLEVEPNKTKILSFGSQSLGKAEETFTFLGFTHYVARSRKGSFKVGRKTDRKRFRVKLKGINATLRGLRTKGAAAMLEFLRQHLRGIFGYYAVSENSRAITAYYWLASKLLFKWLNRRSGRKSITWVRFTKLLEAGLLPFPRIIHSFYTTTTRT